MGQAGETVMGLSKLTRIVRVTAKRFTSQEQMGYQIADILKVVRPTSVAVVVCRCGSDPHYELEGAQPGVFKCSEIEMTLATFARYHPHAAPCN